MKKIAGVNRSPLRFSQVTDKLIHGQNRLVRQKIMKIDYTNVKIKILRYLGKNTQNRSKMRKIKFLKYFFCRKY